jgi:hypothetical protein
MKTTIILSSWLLFPAFAALALACGAPEASPDESFGELEEALASNEGAPNKTKSELEADGYSCERIGSAGYSCSKKDAPDYLCDLQGTCLSAFVLPPSRCDGPVFNQAPTTTALP